MTGEMARLVALALASLSLLYVAAATWLVARYPPRTRHGKRGTGAAAWPPVTVLKPLCGAESGLYESLRSFCRQDYPDYQVVFGASDPDDPALEVARRLADEFPGLDLRVVTGTGADRGPNLKADNLARMLPAARHEHLVISDSDIMVGPEYLRGVLAPLSADDVGVVTCLYTARPLPTPWARLGALAVNEWFLPSVLVARALGSTSYCSGSTMAIRREVLDSIGGFEALSGYLADDYVLGELCRRRGLRTVLADYVVTTLSTERSVRELIRHQLRWARTTRAVEPWGHAFSFLTYAVPLACIAVPATSGWGAPLSLPLAALALRVALHYSARMRFDLPEDILALSLVPACDAGLFLVWAGSFLGRRVRWRGRWLRIGRDGRLEVGSAP